MKTNKELIYDFILDYPGVHLRQIFKELNLSEGTIKYHIDYLMKHELITKQNIDGYARFFVNKKISSRDKIILSYIRNTYSRSIILYLFNSVCGSQKDICNFIDKDSKNVSRYIKNLLKDDVIEVATVKDGVVNISLKICKTMEYDARGREILYKLKNPYELYDLFLSHRNKFLDDGTTDDVLEFLNCLHELKNSRPKQMKSTKKIINEIVDRAFEVFPHPYHC